MALAFHRFDDVDGFLAATGDFLAAREAEHNLLWGITSQVRGFPELFEEPPTFASVTDDGGRVIAATLRTPPWNQVLSEVDDPAAVDLLAEELSGQALPGVTGPSEAAARFAAAWTERTGRRSGSSGSSGSSHPGARLPGPGASRNQPTASSSPTGSFASATRRRRTSRPCPSRLARRTDGSRAATARFTSGRTTGGSSASSARAGRRRMGSASVRSTPRRTSAAGVTRAR
jgi:hypothetical protein